MQRITRAKNTVIGTAIGTVNQIDETISSGKSKLKNTIDSGREWIYRFVIVTLTALVLIFASVFMYGSFYFAFIPVVEHEASLHVGFQPCFDTPQKCGFINASVSMNMLSGTGGQGANPERPSPVLMAGQPYTVVVALNMPESPRNLDLGMFMSCLQVASSDKTTKSGKEEIIRSSCKSSMIQYRSALLRTIETLILAPFYMSGHLVEKQNVYIEFFDDFKDNPLNPANQMEFELQSRFAEVYNARLIIHAKFVGIRYFMFYYPATSAIVGIALNFNVLAIVVMVSWLRFFAPSSERRTSVEEQEDVQEVEELNGSITPGTSNMRESDDDENHGTESRRSSDLEILNNDSVCQLDSEEDMMKNKAEAKKNL